MPKILSFFMFFYLLSSNVHAQNSAQVLTLTSKLSNTGASYILPISIGIIFLLLGIAYFLYSKFTKK